MTPREHQARHSLALLTDELRRVEELIGSGSARNMHGQHDRAQARTLMRLRYRQSLIKARITQVRAGEGQA